MPTPNVKNQAADQEIAKMFRDRNQEPPKIIPQEEAEATRAEVLEARQTSGSEVRLLKQTPKEPPKPQTPKPAPKQPTLAKVTATKSVPIEAPWEPYSREAEKARRWKRSSFLSLLLSTIASLMWLALQTDDATVRLAVPVIIACHIGIGISLLYAWLWR